MNERLSHNELLEKLEEIKNQLEGFKVQYNTDAETIQRLQDMHSGACVLLVDQNEITRQLEMENKKLERDCKNLITVNNNQADIIDSKDLEIKKLKDENTNLRGHNTELSNLSTFLEAENKKLINKE